jgi:hypothetical protein
VSSFLGCPPLTLRSARTCMRSSNLWLRRWETFLFVVTSVGGIEVRLGDEAVLSNSPKDFASQSVTNRVLEELKVYQIGSAEDDSLAMAKETSRRIARVHDKLSRFYYCGVIVARMVCGDDDTIK